MGEGETDNDEGPVDLLPVQRAGQGWRALGLEAKRGEQRDRSWEHLDMDVRSVRQVKQGLGSAEGVACTDFPGGPTNVGARNHQYQ